MSYGDAMIVDAAVINVRGVYQPRFFSLDLSCPRIGERVHIRTREYVNGTLHLRFHEHHNEGKGRWFDRYEPSFPAYYFRLADGPVPLLRARGENVIPFSPRGHCR